MINIIIGSFIGATLSSIIMTFAKVYAMKSLMNKSKEIIAEISKLDTDED